MNVRLTDEEWERVRKWAFERRLSVSALVRSAALEKLDQIEAESLAAHLQLPLLTGGEFTRG